MSLTDEQIATIVRWVDAGAPMGDPKDMPAGQTVARRERMESGQGTGPAGSGDQVRSLHHGGASSGCLVAADFEYSGHGAALGARRRDPARNAAGRKITHHAVAYLVQDDPSSLAPGQRLPTCGARSFLMEWAIGKGYDLYRPDTGKLMLPGSQISWDVHIHAVGEEIRDNVELGIWLYPKGQEPKHRTYLTGFQAAARLQIFRQLADAGRPQHRYRAEFAYRRPTITRC